MVVGEFRGDGLAENHAARLPEERHARRIALRPVAAVDRRVVFGGQIGGVDDVLDAEGHAVQARAARHAIERARLRERRFAIDERPGAHRFIARGNALEAGGDERFRRCFTWSHGRQG